MLNVSDLQRLHISQLPLEKLASNSQLSEADKLSEVSRQFEAILLRQILGEAQKPVFQSKVADKSTAGGIYRDLITRELADQISRSGSFGLARSLESQLQRQVGSDPHLSATPLRPTTVPKVQDPPKV